MGMLAFYNPFSKCGCAREMAQINLTLGAVLTALNQLNKAQGAQPQMSQALDNLTAQVSKNTTVIGSAVVLIRGFSARLEEAGTDPAKLAALQSELDSNDTALADAVAANTPAA